MRDFITLPLLCPGEAKTWTNNRQEYIIRELYLDAGQIESFHEEAQARFLEVEMKSGIIHKIDLPLEQLLELLGVSNAPTTTQD